MDEVQLHFKDWVELGPAGPNNEDINAISIPKMCFMKNALAIANMTHKTYMVEEVIDEVVHGMFVKYIGNGSMKLYEFLNDATAY